MKKILLALLIVLAEWNDSHASGVATPPLVVEGFGVNAGGSYITNPLPIPSQISVSACRASYNDGFPPQSMTPTGCNPFGQDMNGVLFAATQNTAAWVGGQYWPFSTGFATNNSGYAAGAIIAMGAGNGFWINQNGGNAINPDTATPSTTPWAPLVSYGAAAVNSLTSGTITLTTVQASYPIIYLSGSLSGNVQVIFPTWQSKWILINQTTGGFSVTAKTASGTGVIVPQSGATSPIQVYGDGTNIQPLSQVAQSLSAHKSSSTARASTTTLTNDPDLVLSVPGAGTYQITGELFFQQNFGGGGIKIALNFTGSTSVAVAHISGYVDGSAVLSPGIAAAGFVILNAATIDSIGTFDVLGISGTIIASTAGTYSVQWAQNSSNPNPTGMLPASFIKLSPLN